MSSKATGTAASAVSPTTQLLRCVQKPGGDPGIMIGDTGERSDRHRDEREGDAAG
jgi:hypothetical protein